VPEPLSRVKIYTCKNLLHRKMRKDPGAETRPGGNSMGANLSGV
jgi:hypothetical protein